jgi:hypothetical protein
MGFYSLMLRGGIAVGLVLAGIADDLGGVQAVFYSAAHNFLRSKPDQWIPPISQQRIGELDWVVN